MIEAVGLTKYYGSFAAIRGVRFKVDEGEIVGLLGPNAAGKTTTMRILTGYTPPSDGTATVAGYDVFADSLKVRQHLGYLPETVPLYTDLSVAVYLDFMASLRGVVDRKKRVAKVMGLCALEHVADVVIGKLSKGYRQRVGLAQALVHDPPVLILDEPTIGLDPKQVAEVRSLIKGLGNDRTIILSSHILSEVSQVCNRVIIINEGQVVAEDTPERLNRRLKGRQCITIRLLNPTDDIVNRLGSVPGVSAVEPRGRGVYDIEGDVADERRAEIAALASANAWGLVEMYTSGLSLEDIFLKLTDTERGSRQRGREMEQSRTAQEHRREK